MSLCPFGAHIYAFNGRAFFCAAKLVKILLFS
jgi:hypothetical protein